MGRGVILQVLLSISAISGCSQSTSSTDAGPVNAPGIDYGESERDGAPDRTGDDIHSGDVGDSHRDSHTDSDNDAGLQSDVMIATCGNGVCEVGESVASCSMDCCSELYEQHEAACVQDGWKLLAVVVDGVPRRGLWKAPGATWPNGAIIALHGGGGTHSNFCSNIKLGQPMVAFGNLALADGFALFSLDSTFNKVTDANGNPYGKRWDSLAQLQRDNIDLPFIEKVIVDTIAGLRPAGSSEAIFITGISNGGFMATLAATHFDDKISAFAPVNSGDPYGTYLDTEPNPTRECAFGVFRDSETQMTVNEIGACSAASYANENQWASTNPPQKPSFKLFYHDKDGVLDLSCKTKVRDQLVAHGYADDGSFVVSGLLRSVLNHFWRQEYNAPMLTFFQQHKNP